MRTIRSAGREAGDLGVGDEVLLGDREFVDVEAGHGGSAVLSGLEEFGDEGLDASVDFVADGADGVDPLSGGVVEFPVEVAFAGVEGAFVAAAHGDDDVAGVHGGVGELLWCGAIGGQVDAEFAHGVDDGGVDGVGGCGAGGANRDLIAGVMGEQRGSHL